MTGRLLFKALYNNVFEYELRLEIVEDGEESLGGTLTIDKPYIDGVEYDIYNREYKINLNRWWEPKDVIKELTLDAYNINYDVYMTPICARQLKAVIPGELKPGKVILEDDVEVSNPS